MKFIYAIFIWLFLLKLCYCQVEDTVKIYPMKEVVITATRSEKGIMEVGKNISLIAGEQIQNSPFSLSETIASQEGVFIVGAGQNPGMNQSIFLRGANSNQTTLMIDDIRITDPSSVNNAPDLSELSLVSINKIEIVRGLNSTLYGSSAIGGVINMLSKKKMREGINADVNIVGGTFGKGTFLFGQNLFFNYTFPSGFYLSTELNNVNVQGIDATVDTVTDLNVYDVRDQDDFQHRDIFGKVGFENGNWDVYVSYKRTKQKKDLDKRAFVDDDNYKLDFKRNFFSFGLAYKLNNNLSFKFVNGFSNMERNAIDDSSLIDFQGNSDQTFSDEKYRGACSTHEFQSTILYEGFDLVVGGSYYRETMSSRLYFYSGLWGGFESFIDLDTLKLNTSTRSLFFHADFDGKLIDESLDDLSLAMGGRLLNHSTFGTKFVYEINPSMRVNGNTLLYTSFATGFNSPSLYQLYSPNKDFVSGITRGNIRLKPETSCSFEIGLKQSVSKIIDFGLNYFHTRTMNLIEYVYLWDKNIGLDTLGNDWMRNDYRGDTYLNIGKQIVQGIELNIKSEITEKFTVISNACLLDGRIIYNPSDIDTSVTQGNHTQLYSNGAFMNRGTEVVGLVRRPSIANLSFVYLPYKTFSLGLDIRYIGRRGDIFYDSKLGPFGALGSTPVADYTLVSVYSGLRIQNNIMLLSRVENIFNTVYYEIKGFSTRGRGFYLNVRYSL